MMSTTQTIAFAIAAVACTLAVRTDLASRRIPNAITLPLLAAAPLLAAFDGWRAVIAACGIVAGALVIGACLHAMGVLGGGDVKLLAGISALVGFPWCLDVALYTGICGGLLALIFAAARGELRGLMARLPTGVRLPYALAIGTGFALTTAGATVFPALRIVQ